jgi:NADH dehydrogenase (ubiquinone) 1 alpha subcomplex subunit 13
VDTARIFERRGPKGWQLWAGLGLAITVGFYGVKKTNEERAQQHMSERRARYAIAPMLQAEADREYLAREEVIRKREAEIMQDVPGWTPGKSPYWSGKFMPRRVYDLDKNLK